MCDGIAVASEPGGGVVVLDVRAFGLAAEDKVEIEAEAAGFGAGIEVSVEGVILPHGLLLEEAGVAEDDRMPDAGVVAGLLAGLLDEREDTVCWLVDAEVAFLLAVLLPDACLFFSPLTIPLTDDVSLPDDVSSGPAAPDLHAPPPSFFSLGRSRQFVLAELSFSFLLDLAVDTVSQAPSSSCARPSDSSLPVSFSAALSSSTLGGGTVEDGRGIADFDGLIEGEPLDDAAVEVVAVVCVLEPLGRLDIGGLGDVLLDELALWASLSRIRSAYEPRALKTDVEAEAVDPETLPLGIWAEEAALMP